MGPDRPGGPAVPGGPEGPGGPGIPTVLDPAGNTSAQTSTTRQRHSIHNKTGTFIHVFNV